MIVLEAAITTPPLGHYHVWRKYPGLDDLWVELHLVACDWVDERRNQLEEGVEQKRNIEN